MRSSYHGLGALLDCGYSILELQYVISQQDGLSGGILFLIGINCVRNVCHCDMLAFSEAPCFGMWGRARSRPAVNSLGSAEARTTTRTSPSFAILPNNEPSSRQKASLNAFTGGLRRSEGERLPELPAHVPVHLHQQYSPGWARYFEEFRRAHRSVPAEITRRESKR